MSGRVAIVTGGTRGIGLAIAGALVATDARVAVIGRQEAALQQARDVLVEAAGGDADRVAAISADVGVQSQVEQSVAQVVERFGGLDILVNNAGVGTFGEVASMPSAIWTETIATNLTGVFYCCQAAIPHLRRRGGGWVINISSLAGKNPFAGGAAYCASKAGLNAFTEALMQEVRYEGIRVSLVMPGSVRTEFAGTHDGAGTEWKLAPSDVAGVVIDLLRHHPRSLPSRVEIRPSTPRK
jgi:NAD(P)-dependent dehydrogenase (short-subunit alcohol dehydrogenase family)